MSEGAPHDQPRRRRCERYEEWFGTRFGRRADRVERSILSHLLSQVPEAGTLLDIGSGTGHFADLWSSRGLVAVGIDIDLEALDYSRTHRPWFPVVRGDAARLPVRSASADIAAMITVLEFVGDPARALREAARVARRAVIVGSLNAASPVACWRRLRRSRTYAKATFHTRGGLAGLVRASIPGRAAEVRLETGLYPVPWSERVKGPLGAFTGMLVRLR